MRIIIFLLVATAASLFAWSRPPTVYFVGRVLSTRKVTDVSVATNANGTLNLLRGKLSEANRDKIIHWEIWKAEVKLAPESRVQTTNLAEKVFVYYNQDWSTNFVTPYGVEVGHPARLRLGTNQVYEFFCDDLDGEDKQLEALNGGETNNTFRAYDGLIKPH